MKKIFILFVFLIPLITISDEKSNSIDLINEVIKRYDSLNCSYNLDVKNVVIKKVDNFENFINNECFVKKGDSDLCLKKIVISKEKMNDKDLAKCLDLAMNQCRNKLLKEYNWLKEILIKEKEVYLLESVEKQPFYPQTLNAADNDCVVVLNRSGKRIK